MVADALFEDLEVFDFLQLLNSTVKASDAMGISQSSCSRRYRALSECLDLDFDRVDGAYRPQRNLDVLCALREASQKVRVRRQQVRVSLAWPYQLFKLCDRWRNLPVQTMSTSRMLTLLDERLLDLWLGGLYECQPLLQQPLMVMGPQQIKLTHNLLCIPLFRWPLQLLAHRDHPLQKQSKLTPEDLAMHPSPALPHEAAPLLNQALQRHGLASSPLGTTDYDSEIWEGFARDGNGLSYGPVHRQAELERRWQLQPLSYDLGITDVAAVIGHRDVLSDPVFRIIFKDLIQILRASSLGFCSKIQWLL